MSGATIFKGIKQVTYDYFSGLTDEEKQGYIWFVRSNIEASGDTETYNGDIFLGTRHYGHFGGEVSELEDKLNSILYNEDISAGPLGVFVIDGDDVS